nr:hypothetical protein [Nitrospirales bacterium]
GMLKDTAFRWSFASTAGQSLNPKVRIAVVDAIVAFSEFGNQLHARADALMKQLKPNGLDRRELPPSVALRETETTDFHHLYNWMNADIGSFASTLAGLPSVKERVKIIESLFADHFWSKINTVYASGRGKIGMAFIKDDVGNWNLKNFDNDPEDLLKAYTAFSIEALKKAAEIAAEGFAPGKEMGTKTVSQLIKMASQTAFGGPNVGNSTRISGIFEGLHQSLDLQLSKKERECAEIGGEKFTECIIEIKKILTLHEDMVDGIARNLLPNPNTRDD